MTYNYLTSDEDRNGSKTQIASVGASPGREPIKHMLIGTPKSVTSTQQALHRLGYVPIDEWSPFMPSPNPGEVMSILVRHILVQ